MSKFSSLQDAFNYFEESGGNGNSTSFFQLKNDKESTVVRFLHEGEDDIDWYIVHQAEVNGKKRWVKCTEEADCPLCNNKNKPQLRVFLQMIDKRDPDKIKVWDRGQKFIPKLTSFVQRYKTLCGQPVEIERTGKAGDKQTDYQLYPLEKDNKTLQDLPMQREELSGENSLILVKSQDELQQIANGTITPDNGGGNSTNVQNANSQAQAREDNSPWGNADIF